MKTSRFLLGLAAPLAFAVPAFSAATAGGPPFDFSINNISIVQTIPDVTLIGGKSTCVRVEVKVLGVDGVVPAIDAQLRIFVGGVEEPYSPIYTQNGPLSLPRTGFNLANLDDSLNFYFVAPTSNDVELIVEINPPGPNQACEVNYANNTGTTGSLVFECKDKVEVIYVPIDYRPSGGGANLPDPDLIKPGVGDNFIQAIYPSGDWDYHRSDLPSKLWTNSLNSTGGALLNSLLADLNMMSPQPDFMYGWIRGGLPYNGQANGAPGRVGIGNTQPFKHQRTFAHELGHLFGRNHLSAKTNRIGIDVEHHLNETEGLAIIKATNLNDIMVPGLNSNQAWVYNNNYEFFANHARFQCTEDSGVAQGEGLMVGGLWNRDADTVEWTDHVAFSGGIATPTVALNEANLILRTWSAGSVSGEFGLAVTSTTDSCADRDVDGNTSDSWEGQVNLAGFMAVLPDTLPVATLEQVDVINAATGAVMATLKRSATAPAVALIAPQSGSQLSSEVVVSWTAADADGDALTSYVRYSPDGSRMVPLASNVKGSSITVDLASLPVLQSGGYIEVLTTDGLRTSIVRSTGLTVSQQRAAAPPFGNILTPDDGKSYQKGAMVILHGAGWDIDDRSLEGASLQWTSSLDGIIGMGRVDQLASLSVGTHMITLAVTDSNSNTTTDSVTITIGDRVLPSEVCQENIGFGGPGTALLQVCGGDLSTGTTAQVQLLNAAPSAFLFLIYSDMSNPVSALGGTLVPLPILGLEMATTDASGNWTLPTPLNGGGGPFTLYGQAVYLDPVFTFGISNAVKLNYLP